jgi:hypothetical protein
MDRSRVLRPSYGNPSYKSVNRQGESVPHCQNCESYVTEAYVRVFAPDSMDSVRVCPHCEDKLRDGADVREARAPRQQ